MVLPVGAPVLVLSDGRTIREPQRCGGARTPVGATALEHERWPTDDLCLRGYPSSGGVKHLIIRIGISIVLSVGLSSGVHRVSGLVDASAGASGPQLLDTSAGLIPVEPYRLTDTRSDGTGRLAGREVRFVPVRGRGGVPAEASAVSVNVTAVDPSEPGYLTVWPCASRTEQPPLASVVNFVAGQTRANAAVAGIGSTGGLCVFSLVAVDLIVDVMAFVQGDVGVNPILPHRVFDSRESTGILPAGRVERITFAGRGGVPSDADSVFAVVTTTESLAPGYVTIWPCESRTERPPLASVANFEDGGAVASNGLVALADDGAACVYVYASTHLVLDVTAWVSADSVVRAVVPERLLDTRASIIDNPTAAVLQCGSLPGRGGCTVTNDLATFLNRDRGSVVVGGGSIPTDASAVIVTLTAVAGAESYGFATAWPADEVMPTASVLNFEPGEVVPNTVIVGLVDRAFDLYVHTRTDVVVDIVGYVGPSTDAAYLRSSTGTPIMNGSVSSCTGSATPWGSAMRAFRADRSALVSTCWVPGRTDSR